MTTQRKRGGGRNGHFKTILWAVIEPLFLFHKHIESPRPAPTADAAREGMNIPASRHADAAYDLQERPDVGSWHVATVRAAHYDGAYHLRNDNRCRAIGCSTAVAVQAKQWHARAKGKLMRGPKPAFTDS
jgi:hypothetical protein